MSYNTPLVWYALFIFYNVLLATPVKKLNHQWQAQSASYPFNIEVIQWEAVDRSELQLQYAARTRKPVHQ